MSISDGVFCWKDGTRGSQEAWKDMDSTEWHGGISFLLLAVVFGVLCFKRWSEWVTGGFCWLRLGYPLCTQTSL